MDGKKYIGMDAHKESISITVMNGAPVNGAPNRAGPFAIAISVSF